MRAMTIFKKDLLIESRSKSGLGQVLPFALIVLLLFGFAFDTQGPLMVSISPGLFWVLITFSSILLVSRSMRVESENDAVDGLLLLGFDGISIFVGKFLALFLILLILDILVGSGVVVLFSVPIHSFLLLSLSTLLATAGIGSVGLVFGALVRGANSSESLVPMLVLPILAPVVISATKAWSDALNGHGSIFDPWLKLLLVFAVVFIVVGAVSFGAILED